MGPEFQKAADIEAETPIRIGPTIRAMDEATLLRDELSAALARVKALEEGLRAEHDRLKAEFDKGCQFGHSDAYHVDEYCGHCDPLHDRLKLIAALLAGPGGSEEGR